MGLTTVWMEKHHVGAEGAEWSDLLGESARTETQNAIDAAMAATGAASIKDMGKVMGQLKPKLQGRADMGAVSAMIKAKLG